MAGYNIPLDISATALETSVQTIDDFVDTEVASILAAVDTEVAAIKAKTDNLPASPEAAASAIFRGTITLNNVISATAVLGALGAKSIIRYLGQTSGSSADAKATDARIEITTLATGTLTAYVN